MNAAQIFAVLTAIFKWYYIIGFIIILVLMAVDRVVHRNRVDPSIHRRPGTILGSCIIAVLVSAIAAIVWPPILYFESKYLRQKN